VYRERGMQPPSFLRFPMYTHMREHLRLEGQQVTDDTDYPVQALLMASRNFEEAVTVVSNGMRNKISSMLGIAVDTIDASNSVASYGIDSLSAIEVRTWLMKDLGANIPFLQIVGANSIHTISQKAVSAIKSINFSPEQVNTV
jgi:acyl carrier protein